jgi:hypothetical protein
LPPQAGVFAGEDGPVSQTAPGSGTIWRDAPRARVPGRIGDIGGPQQPYCRARQDLERYRYQQLVGWGVGMDPVTLILTALAAGAGLGLKDAASSAVTDAYNGLKGLVRRRLVGRPDAELVLARHEQDPQVWDKPLGQELTAADAAQDAGLVTAAQAFLALADATGTAAGKYTVAADHSVAAGRDVKITPSGGGTAAGVIHGNVAPPGPTPPGPGQG